MRRKWMLALAILVALAGAAAVTLVAMAGGDVPEGAETLTLEVRGMRTMMCEMAVRSALEGLDGVRGAAVDREAGTAVVAFDPATAHPPAFVEAVGAMGFEATLPAGFADAEPEPAAPPAAHAATPSRLSPEQVATVAAYVSEQIIETGEIPQGTAIEEATGVTLAVADTPVLQQAVLARLADDPRGRELLAGSRCSDYGACSLWGNLAGASGEVLARYEEEKALDGVGFEDRPLPAFAARDLAGRPVGAGDLAGRPALIALLAVHCNHSMETLPILQALHRRHGREGLRVVGLLINSGTVEDANGWIPHFAPEHPIWVAEGETLADAVGSHLVPTFLLVDGDGRLRRILVGQRDEASVLDAVAEIHAPASS